MGHSGTDCVTVRNHAGTCTGICSYNLVYNVLMQLFPLKSLVFVVHFLNAFWHGKETFPKSNSQNEIVALLIVFHLPYSKYKSVKICFYSCRYQNQNFHSCPTCFISVAVMLHLCRTRVARVSFVAHSCRQCRTRVAFMSLVLLLSGTCVVNQIRSHLNGFS